MTTETTTNDHYRLACSVLDLVAERHENGDHDTLPQEQQVMDLLHAAANEGYKPALVADAVLASSNDWSTMRITRNGLFVMMLEEAIDAGRFQREKLWYLGKFPTFCDNRGGRGKAP